MQEKYDSFGLPVAIGLVIGAILGLFIQNMAIGLGLGFVGSVIYTVFKNRDK